MNGPGVTVSDEELHEFLLLVRRALLMIVRWIERKYTLDPRSE